MEEPKEITAWRQQGRELNVFGRRIFVTDLGQGAGDPILFLHGFPTSSFDFRQVMAQLSKNRRVVAHDHLGFGLSEKPTQYSYSLLEQADFALGVWRALGITKGHVVGHDYGTTVANELCTRAVRGLLPFELSSVTFCNGSMMLELAQLRVTQKLMRSTLTGPLFAKLASYRTFRLQLRAIFGRPDAVSDRELELAWWLINSDDGRARLHPLSQYIGERARFRERWIDSLPKLEVPMNLLWAKEDPIAVTAIPEALARACPKAKTTWLDGLGHYPMLEDPARWAASLSAMLG